MDDFADRHGLAANPLIRRAWVIGDHSVVAAGAVVREGTVAPPNNLIVGVPARVIFDEAIGFRSDV